RKDRPSFAPIVQTALGRLRKLLDSQQLARMPRPNQLSFAGAMRGLGDPTSGRLRVQACLDLVSFALEETVRGVTEWRKKGGESGDAAASILSWFRRFLEGY
ncbi:MAG: hypothetical protein ACE5F1_13480, partial [Planctomycetota bacterium]